MTERKKSTSAITDSGGNVFADLGFDNPEELTAKAELALIIGRVIKRRRLTQVQAGKLLGIPQADVSRLLRGEIDRFSTDKLMHLMMHCDRDVEIVIKRRPAKRKESRLSVRTA